MTQFSHRCQFVLKRSKPFPVMSRENRGPLTRRLRWSGGQMDLHESAIERQPGAGSHLFHVERGQIYGKKRNTYCGDERVGEASSPDRQALGCETPAVCRSPALPSLRIGVIYEGFHQMRQPPPPKRNSLASGLRSLLSERSLRAFRSIPQWVWRRAGDTRER